MLLCAYTVTSYDGIFTFIWWVHSNIENKTEMNNTEINCPQKTQSHSTSYFYITNINITILDCIKIKY